MFFIRYPVLLLIWCLCFFDFDKRPQISADYKKLQAQENGSGVQSNYYMVCFRETDPVGIKQTAITAHVA
jgi:hypothetical protein